ncbi:sensor histidine kinase [Oleidesulfovibrio sp.]|uniref:sensor histidine kinase n=1 Tax=Oleidesulfovibrio sp. TaxID=2909707 RepID=UPI003A8B089D
MTVKNMPKEAEVACTKGHFIHVRQRVEAKMQDYERYSFSSRQTRAFNVFFDLAQEFDSLEEVYTLAVLILKSFFGVDSALFIATASGELELSCCSSGPVCTIETHDIASMAPLDGPKVIREHLCLPVRGKLAVASGLSSPLAGDRLGVLVIMPVNGKAPEQHLYFEKFANRLGFQLHNKLLFMKNSEHIRFINSLVHDIGHNVIVPNMYFKLLFRQLDGKIQALSEALEEISNQRMPNSEFADAFRKLTYVHDRLDEQYKEIFRHFQQTSLFLETLLRQSHFEKGHYVLQRTLFDLHSRIVSPQLERFRVRFEEKDIDIHESPLLSETPLLVPADMGLISQVLANLLSNAVKYARAPVPQKGQTEQTGTKNSRFVRCTVRRLENYFGQGQDGARVDVFTSGPTIKDEDIPNLFAADFRGSNTEHEYGTGHGLFFVREIMELHKGEAGYEAWPEGNNFYFVLPCDPTG